MKKILFDLDNTLISWKPEYRFLSCSEAGITDLNIVDIIDKAIPKYEESVEYITKDSLIDCLLDLKIGLTSEQAKRLIETDTNRYEKSSDEVIELLEYLSNKYELYVITNWFLDIQSKRLENAGILKYFKKVYSASEYKAKPDKEMFLKAMGDTDPSECLMLGDSLIKDVYPALEIGMEAILIGKAENYKCIDSILKLKEML